ncbi:uncharacterized protein LOC120737178 [Simochromis diagramma]|uniref:uncharacterized protein LOC120737178 n=1 Tax=Simochromis diagramma TaxID=43689 RepID=UPI001A7EC24F|nr:uncharacterized protein LOC120737178 [Simochromis diagramma]
MLQEAGHAPRRHHSRPDKGYSFSYGTCCVVGCNVRAHDREGKKLDNGLSFHRFPSWRQREGSHVSDITKQRRQAWIAAVRRADIEFRAIPSFLLVCSRHFLSGFIRALVLELWSVLECSSDDIRVVRPKPTPIDPTDRSCIKSFLYLVNLLSSSQSVWQLLGRQSLANKSEYTLREMPTSIPVSVFLLLLFHTLQFFLSSI